MKKIVILVVSSLFLVLSTTAMAASPSDPLAVIQQSVAVFMEKNKAPGLAVELYVDGKPYAYYFGYANAEKKTPVTSKTIFEVGSLSKIMTSILLAQAVDFAKMSFADPVSKYLDDFPEAMDEVTVQNLATHTAGLPFDAPSTVKTNTDLTGYLASLHPRFTADDAWMYSNVGVGVLGLTLEKATHKTLSQLYQKQILSPLGMQAIGFTVPSKLKANYAQGYDAAGKPISHEELGLFPAAWGIKMSAGDMQRFLKAAIGLPGTPERLFYPIKMTQAVFVKTPESLQGLTWQVHPLAHNVKALLNESASTLGPVNVTEVLKIPSYDGDALIDKTGATTGFKAYIAVIPNKKTGVGILTNKYVANADIVKLGREILFKVNHL